MANKRHKPEEIGSRSSVRLMFLSGEAWLARMQFGMRLASA